MAEVYMKKKLALEGIEGKHIVESAGVRAIPGEESTSKARDVMKKYGISLEKHTATNIKDIDIYSYDLILVMSKSHRDNILEIYDKSLEQKIHLLKEYLYETKEDEYMDIDDPWGLDITVYEYCAKEITDSIDKLIEKLKERKEV